MGNIEEWVRKWLEDQRQQGKKCLEIKMRGSKYYVYHSTTRYDKEIKKGRKVSKYLGKLDKKKGFIPKEQNKRAVTRPRNVTEYGNSMLLHEMLKDIKPWLKEGFWQCPFKTGKRCMEETLQCRRHQSGLNSENLSNVLREVGANRPGQNIVFKALTDMSDHLVYDPRS